VVRPTWEYARLAYERTTNLGSRAQLPDGTWEEQTWESNYYWWLPGKIEPEVIPEHEMQFLDFLNRVGAKGWELIAETTRGNAVGHNHLGWPTAGIPVDIRWTFKRQRT
jgi:hypothetical protein